MNILLADSEKAFLQTLEEMILRDCGAYGQLNIDSSTDIDQAMSKLAEDRFDLCFLDQGLGVGTGTEVLRTVAQMDIHTAIIFLTEQADKNAAYTALSLGAMDYLVKAQLDSFGLLKSIAFSLYRKSKEMELRGAALHDSLTGLGNRTLFREQAAKLLQHAKRARDHAAVVFMDVDGLKPVNDTFGHQVGDQLLKQVAARLVERARESDIVARVGGDEFLVLLGHVDGAKVVARVTKDLTEAIELNSFRIGNHDIRVGLSCGTAIFPEDSENIDDLIRLADKRMYETKALHKKSRQGAQMSWLR